MINIFKRRGFVLTTTLIILIYLLVTTYMYIFQRDFVFVTRGKLTSPEENGLNNVLVENVEMKDGTQVVVWRAEPTKENAPTILYLHGNSGTISRRSNRFKHIFNSGFGLYVPVYRGYPGSEGSPTETNVISDAIEHFDRAKEFSDTVVVLGESLGSGIAVAVGTEREVPAIILEAPYTAIVDVASAQYPLLPVPYMMKDTFLTRERIKFVTEPVLVVHGDADSLIPVRHGRRIYELANEPKEIQIIEGATHGNLWDNGLWDSVTSFLIRQSIYSEN